MQIGVFGHEFLDKTVVLGRAELTKIDFIFESYKLQLFLPGNANFQRGLCLLGTSFGLVPNELHPNRGFSPNYAIPSTVVDFVCIA
jgi:hypothetical protein